MAFSKNAFQPYGKSRTCQWFLKPTAARGATALTDALYFRHQQRRRHRGFHLRLLPAFAPRPHQPLRHHARSLERARSHVRLDSFLFLRARRLRHRRTLSVAVESPRVIRAQQRPVALHPSLAQRRQPVRALILEHAPRSHHHFSKPPNLSRAASSGAVSSRPARPPPPPGTTASSTSTRRGRRSPRRRDRGSARWDRAARRTTRRRPTPRARAPARAATRRRGVIPVTSQWISVGGGARTTTEARARAPGRVGDDARSRVDGGAERRRGGHRARHRARGEVRGEARGCGARDICATDIRDDCFARSTALLLTALGHGFRRPGW